MKLELKHLAPYLPYGLKVIDNKGEVFEMSGFSSEHGNSFKMIELMNINESKYFGNFVGIKPILRPMSDLIGQIGLPAIIEDFSYGKRISRSIDLPYWAIIYLCGNNHDNSHYDVFGLIEQGLAVDVNTIES